MRRLAALPALVLLALTVATNVSAALDSRGNVRFRTSPRHAFPGDLVSVSVNVRPSRARCTLSVTYPSGRKEDGLRPVRAVRGRAQWQWRVPDAAEPGTGRLVARCGRSGTTSRPLVIVGAVIPARITVVQKGFSVRPNKTSGSDVSYGVILENESPHQDALDLSVLVNFVDEANVLIGSASSRVAAVGAGRRYAVGGSLAFPGEAPVARLEVVVQVGARVARSLRLPALANIRVLPEIFDAAWVGSVEGEVINDDPRRALERASLSAVVFDSAGNVIGGGTGYAFNALPSGARQFFKMTMGFRAIPMLRADSAVVSVEPTYRQPGS